ncbi:hypothetical protein DCC39_16100 [Pueribacillus theae]|uniref:Uncharacterized protein n=1 Tax=Pueribacillus theae TaxID=2171751 RepID=A0A2U1JSN1_9BACI|nr:hypothetical protein [Pueribacillus theae]PWA07818.1 hypothetical protein DCC39_16100 [Pueribacillus theae]
MKRKYGLMSIILCILGLLLIYFNSLSQEGIIGVYFFIGIIFWIASIVLGIGGIALKEKGCLKYMGILIIFLILIGYALLIILFAITGFGA